MTNRDGGEAVRAGLYRTAKSSVRAELYRRAIAAKHAEGCGRDALAEALRWLRSEAAHAEKRRPRDAEVLYRQLTEQIARLAEAIPTFAPSRHRTSAKEVS